MVDEFRLSTLLIKSIYQPVDKFFLSILSSGYKLATWTAFASLAIFFLRDCDLL